MDNKLIQGLLIASCALLLFAIIMTMADILHYKDAGVGVPVRTAAPAPTAAPAEPRLPPAPAALELAPTGTMGYATVDVAGLLSSEVVQGILAQGGPMPPEVEQLDSMTWFLQEPEGPPAEGQAPSWCGVIKMKGTTLTEIEAGLAEEGSPVTVEGMDAYQMQAPMGMGPGPQQVLVAVVDDTTVLMGSEEDALAQVIMVHEGGQQADVSEMWRMGSKFADDHVSIGLVLTEEMTADLEGPAWMAGARGGGLGITLSDRLSVRGALTLASAADAEQAVAEAQAKISEAKDEMAAQAEAFPMMADMMQPMADLLDKIQISAKGADVQGSLAVGEQELESLIGMAMMGMMGAMGGDAEMMMGEPMDFPGAE